MSLYYARFNNFELIGGTTGPTLQSLHTWLISDGSARGIAVGGGHFADPGGGTYVIPGASPGGDAILIIRAWVGNYGSWIAAANAPGEEPMGEVIFHNPVGGGGAPAASLVGMPALNLSSIPEPSPLALLAGAAAAVLAWRRRVL